MKEKPEKAGELQAQVDITTKGLDVDSIAKGWGFKGKNYLFVIGIDTYQHWTPLKCAVKDVQDFTKVLTTRYQFEDACVLKLLNEQGSQKNILFTLRELAQKVTDQDNLVMYFSGHGHYDEITKTGYWVPVDAQIGYENEYQFINTAVIVDRLRNINSLHTFLIIDACFSGTLMTQIRSSPRSEKYKSRRVFTSGRAEVVNDGPEGGNSPFAKGIINHLTQNTEKHIPASKLILDVMEYVEKEAQQTPFEARLMNADDQGGDFVFHLKMSEAEIWASVVGQHTIEGYQSFIEEFPLSEHIDEAQEAHDWLCAKEENAISVLQQYLIKYQPLGKYVPLAIKTLEELEEEKCWQQAKTKDTLSAYFDYLFKYPAGKYIEEARLKTQYIPGDEDDTAIIKAIEEDTEASYKKYLTQSTTKKYQDIAEKKIAMHLTSTSEPSEEEIAWQKTTKVSTYLAYRDFTQVYPKSKYLKEASMEMERLDNIALNKIRLVEHNSTLSLHEKISHCIDYFDKFPGAENNRKVKQIKDRLEIKGFSRSV